MPAEVLLVSPRRSASKIAIQQAVEILKTLSGLTFMPFLPKNLILYWYLWFRPEYAPIAETRTGEKFFPSACMRS